VVAFLSDPASHRGSAVERISTHGAHVFLAGDRAYKMKRAVRYPFMDFSTLERRHDALEAEFVLNKPHAPGLYQCLLPISACDDGRLAWGDARIVDWVLVMHRFDQAALLSHLARERRLSAGDADRLADAVAALHGRATVVHRDEAAIFRRIASDNFASLAALALPDFTTVAARTLAACDDLAPHLASRAAAGFVRRGHGDLHLNNIVMLDGVPTPFDALEFDAALATGDVFYDLAYLLMDLVHVGLRPLANRVLNRYLYRTDDIAGLKALPLFLATRAMIRAKVLALQDAAGAELRRYVTEARDHLAPAAPALIAIGGLSGTGKSTIAEAIAPGLGAGVGAVVLRSDLLRKRTHGVEPATRLPADAYGPEQSAQVYGELAAAAGRALDAGATVIADAVFAQAAQRDAIAAAARSRNCRFVGVWLDAPLESRTGRVTARRFDASDADADVVRAQDGYDVGVMSWATVSAAGSLDAVASAVLKRITGKVRAPSGE
jgi:aminoglycoside phosphotransferase family enzyme/predicted kinase